MTSTDNQFQLDLMSFNIRYGTAQDRRNRWDNRHRLLIDILRENRCSVIALQEALSFQIDAILQGLPHYRGIGAGREDGWRGGEHVSILYDSRRLELDTSSTFWFSVTPQIPGSISWGCRLPRICTWARLIDRISGRGIYVYNVHLDNWSQQSRRKSAAMLMERIGQRKHGDPVALMGDFNTGEFNPVIRFIRGRQFFGTKDQENIKLIDTHRALHPWSLEGTYNFFRGFRFGPRIDFIFVDPSVEILDTRIIRTNENGRYPSDHFPIAATVGLP